MDLAIGVIIGGAFGKIVGSLVDNLISPVIGFLLNGVQLNEALPLKLADAVTKKVTNADGSITETVVTPELVMKFGAFIQTVIDFVAIAFVLFLIVKAMNKMKKKQEAAAPAAPPAPTNEEKLLSEIRDLLKK